MLRISPMKIIPFGRLQLLLPALLFLFSFSPSWSEETSTYQLEQQTVELEKLITLADDNIRQANYETALTSLTQAYELSKQLPDKNISNTVLNSIANVYFNTGQFKQAQRYYSELVEIDEQNDDKASLAVSLFNLGHVYASLKNYDYAERNFKHSLSISKTLDDKSGMAFTFKAMGVNAQAQLNFDSAREYLNEALLGFKAINDDLQAAAVHRHLGDIAQDEQQYELAVQEYEAALPALANNNFSMALLRTYRGLSTAYEQLGNYEKAFTSHHVYTQLLKQQLEQQNKEATQRLQVQFETQQFSDENKRLELENESQQQELQHKQQLLKMQYLIIGLVVSILVLVGILWWRSRIHAQHMKMLATTDELTDLLNRRAILEYGNNEWQRAKRFDRPFCCLLFDIDHFKSINDTFGHAAGDEVLKTISSTVKGSLRKTDAFGRFGGEEFLLVATETEIEQAEVLADRIRQKIEATSHDLITDRHVTVSIGVASMRNEPNLEDLIAHADLALYQAKESGRNKTITYQAD